MISIKEIDLRYSDSDQMGVVYHANYFSFFEMGRTHMLKEYGVEYYKIEEMGYIFPVREVDCTYYQSIRLGEKIRVETQIQEISKIKFQFEHKIYNENQELKALGHTTIICVDKETFKIAKFDKYLPEVYKIKDKI
ncbi:acyl-CoA thioesterase [Candidatus Izimaplasma bacterium]|nr:acyl-CoA thioesterase [Candidatus Izimaplasma bacterium]